MPRGKKFEDVELRVRWYGHDGRWGFQATVHCNSDDSDPGDMPEGLTTMGKRESFEEAMWAGLTALHRNCEHIERGPPVGHRARRLRQDGCPKGDARE